MELKGKTILMLGGSGLVGHAVARELLQRGPKRIVLVALYEDEVRAGAASLAPFAGATEIVTEWGDIFVPADAAKLDRQAILADQRLRETVLGDLLGELSSEVLDRNFLFQLFRRYEPHAVVDCINTATAFAYQDVFHSARDLLDAARKGPVTLEQVEEHVLSIPMPQLIRHVQIMLQCLRSFGTEAYVKVGTSGTGGMGLNIPYTHSEERPSRTLLAKSAVAGAHSLLLWLVARTPGAPATIEIKPTTAIAWREIGYGPVRRRGEPVQLYDCPEPLPVTEAFQERAEGWTDMGRLLESVWADCGENGLFARDEFETVTSLRQMEFITPEEVATYVVSELQGQPTGRDIMAALDASTAGPTYQAGLLRAAAIERLDALEREHDLRSVAFEMLGPPRLTKFLYEAFVLSRLCASVRVLAESDAKQLARQADALLKQDAELRSTIVSVGLPIIVPGGKVYRGELVIIQPDGGDIEAAVARGWVDLRPGSCGTWIRRAQLMVEQAGRRDRRTDSGVEWGAIEPDDPIAPSRFATWIFRYEDEGERIKR
ncbi:MAG: short-chain dehydrogenase [Gemmatimonadota bacterium]|nr:MAG: short-chain dehydrogenase [Gemmatimonadota bacterium]